MKSIIIYLAILPDLKKRLYYISFCWQLCFASDPNFLNPVFFLLIRFNEKANDKPLVMNKHHEMLNQLKMSCRKNRLVISFCFRKTYL